MPVPMGASWPMPPSPLAARALGVGHWDGTSAAAALLLTACMTDTVSDYLGHVTTFMGKMPFFLSKNFSVNKKPCLSVGGTLLFLQRKSILEQLRLSQPLNHSKN